VNPSPARTLRSGFAIYIPYELEPAIRRAPIENGRALQDLFYQAAPDVTCLYMKAD
jgi:hypothetical protein